MENKNVFGVSLFVYVSRLMWLLFWTVIIFVFNKQHKTEKLWLRNYKVKGLITAVKPYHNLSKQRKISWTIACCLL